ncbi:MAG: cytochrome c [Gammaproteobacteria bacterium]
MKSLILFVSTIVITASAHTADIDNGSELHAEKCTVCHDSSLYIRENRKVQTLPRLGTQVRFCKDNLGITWFDDEVDDVVGYLNKNYYHF